MEIKKKWVAIFLPLLMQAQFILAQTRPQTPVEPLSYQNVEVNYQVSTDTAVHLAATLTIPRGSGPFPAILIIGGSGQTSRNQPIYNHQMMFVLSDYFTKMGFATLRFDDRGAGKSTLGSKKISQLTEQDFLADAKAGLDFLKSQPQVDANKVGIVGHSAGATQGLILSADLSNGVWFSVMLAGAINNFPHQIVAHQSKVMAKISGKSERLRIADSAFVARSIYHTVNQPAYDQRLKAITAIATEELNKLSPEEQAELKKSFDTRINILSSELFYAAAQHKSQDPLLKVKCPVLIILGSNDLNVDASLYEPKMKKSMEKNPNPKSKLIVIPGLSHLMQHSKTGLFEESKDIEQTIDIQVLTILGDWISKL